MVFPEATNISGLLGMFTYANLVTDNWSGILIIISLFSSILIYLMYVEPFKDALVTACSITTMASIFFALAELIPIKFMIGIILITLISIIALFIDLK